MLDSLNNILDIHSHRTPPYPIGILAFEPSALPLPEVAPGQLYSVGFHPWGLAERIPSDSDYDLLEKLAQREDVVAIGECGIDMVKGGMLAMQRICFRRQAEIAERVGKPLIIHCVKAHDHILAAYKELQPTVSWLIHGFRGKPSIGKMLTDAGLWLSFGPQFNSETLLQTPLEKILAETDASSVSIEEVIANLEATLNLSLLPRLKENIRELFK